MNSTQVKIGPCSVHFIIYCTALQFSAIIHFHKKLLFYFKKQKKISLTYDVALVVIVLKLKPEVSTVLNIYRRRMDWPILLGFIYHAKIK